MERRIKTINGDEFELLGSNAKRHKELFGEERAGVRKKVKNAYNKRVRKNAQKEINEALEEDLDIHWGDHPFYQDSEDV